MQLAKVTSKGQITIPIDVRRKLGLDKGSSVLFIDCESGFIVMNGKSISLDSIETKPKTFAKSEEYIKAIMAFCENPDETFVEPEELPWTTRENFS